jgi:hypothetical protein
VLVELLGVAVGREAQSAPVLEGTAQEPVENCAHEEETILEVHRKAEILVQVDSPEAQSADCKVDKILGIGVVVDS